jgi:PAS domain S-box-containing protein
MKGNEETAANPRALIVSAQDLRPELEQTVLWRSGVVRRHAADLAAAFEEAKSFQPKLVLVEGRAGQALDGFLASLRGCEATKATAIVVLSRDLSPDAERALVLAGANLIVPLPLNVELWGSRLEQLLLAPPRYQARTPVRAALWSNEIAEGPAEAVEFQGMSLNISTGGMRIEAGRFLLAGAKLDVRFRLPGQQEELSIVAQVVWSVRGAGGLFQSGLQFIVLRERARVRIGEYIATALSDRAGSVAASAAPAALEGLEERQDWERELRVSEGRKMAILDTSSNAIVTADARGVILEFNTAAELLFGRQRSLVLGRSVQELLVPPRLREQLHERYHRLIADRERLFETLQFRAAALRGTGEEFPVEVVLRPMMVKGHLLFTAFMQDLSPLQQAEEERLRLEEQLRQAHKLEAIGTLASGIAHEFNNVLCSIVGYGEMTLSELPSDTIAHANLRQILLAADRAKHIVRQILAFSRRDAVRCRHVRIDAVVNEALELVVKTFPASIEVRREISADAGKVLADPTQLQQIVINLCANALHAMRAGGGTLSISLDTVVVDEQLSSAHVGPPSGAYALLTVKDTGHGMEPEVLARIFDPFFTTKASGEGTGLGLAVVHGIVQRIGGSIFAESACGKGTTFRVYLPLSDGADERAPLERARRPGGAERILFVDNEATITVIARKILESFGYQVTTLTAGADALALVRAEPGAFDLLITDQDMPGISGMELIGEIRALRPALPVILCTGLAEFADAQKAAELRVDAIVLKPFRQADLIESIETVLHPAG